jgi:hypothetical protein
MQRAAARSGWLRLRNYAALCAAIGYKYRRFHIARKPERT